MSADEVLATAAAVAAARPERTLGNRYHLEHVLGRGGMADVWRARDALLNRDVAVKIFKGEAATPIQEQRRHSEIRLLAALSHPNLVTVFDAGTDPGCVEGQCTYLVMELVDGTTLARLLGNGALPAAEIAGVGAQIAGALAYVHARGIVHRDVKPANVLLTAARRVSGGVTAKLADFGVARVLDGARLTTTGTTVGTANYLSPEQASGRDVTPASDVYSLGLVLLESLTGEPAYPGHGVTAALARLHRDPTIPQHLDLSWQGLLAAMTARDPALRPPAATVANRLRTLAGQAGEEPQSTYLSTLVAGAATQQFAVPSPADGAGLAPPAAPHPSLPLGVDWRGESRGSRRGAWLLLAIMVAIAAAAALVLLLMRGSAADGGRATAPTRPYPSVSGTLGSDLRHLQDAVS